MDGKGASSEVLSLSAHSYDEASQRDVVYLSCAAFIFEVTCSRKIVVAGTDTVWSRTARAVVPAFLSPFAR